MHASAAEYGVSATTQNFSGSVEAGGSGATVVVVVVVEVVVVTVGVHVTPQPSTGSSYAAQRSPGQQSIQLFLHVPSSQVGLARRLRNDDDSTGGSLQLPPIQTQPFALHSFAALYPEEVQWPAAALASFERRARSCAAAVKWLFMSRCQVI